MDPMLPKTLRFGSQLESIFTQMPYPPPAVARFSPRAFATAREGWAWVTHSWSQQGGLHWYVCAVEPPRPGAGWPLFPGEQATAATGHGASFCPG